MIDKNENIHILVKYMNIKIVIFYSIFICFINGCQIVPETITIDGIKYRRGFYNENLNPNWGKFSFIGTSYELNDNLFYHLNNQQFDLIYCYYNGGVFYDRHILYCAESQWKIAQNYYLDNNNFIFYCQTVKEYNTPPPIIVRINILYSRFDELMTFAKQYSQDPFGSSKEIRLIPFLNPEDTFQYRFYKKSNDGLFSSGYNNAFHILNGKLVLIFYPQEDKKLLVVNVPDQLSQYFIELLIQNNLK